MNIINSEYNEGHRHTEEAFQKHETNKKRTITKGSKDIYSIHSAKEYIHTHKKKCINKRVKRMNSNGI